MLNVEESVAAFRTTMTIRVRVLRVLQAACALLALLQSSGALAVSPELRIGQLYRTSWTAHDGAPTGIEALAQTSDGYVWFAASAGLFRFDGVRFERVDSVGGQRLPSNNILTLFATQSGGLWIGYRFGGASFISHGAVTNYGEHEGLAAASVTDLAGEPSGVMWATTSRGLKRFNGTLWEDVRERLNLPSEYVKSVQVARDGTLWIVIGRAVMSLRPGQSSFSTTNIETSDEESDFVEARDGTLWLTDQMLGARAVYSPNRTTPVRQSWTALRDGRGEALWGRLIDRDGTLWLTSSSGIHRLNDMAHLLESAFTEAAPTDAYANVEGLSWSALLEDREGNIWMGTASGVYRFRESRLTPVDLPRAANGFAITAGDAGAMLVGIDSTAGLLEITGTTTAEVPRGPKGVTCAYRADDGVVWFGGRGMVWHSRASNDRSVGRPQWIPLAVPVDQVNAGYHPVQAMTQDAAGRLWVSVIRAGIYRLEDGKWTSFGGAAPLTGATAADGRVWFGYPGSRIQIIDGDPNTAHEFSADDGLEIGNVLSIHARTSNVWVGGELGLARFDGRRFHPVALGGGTLLSNVSGIVVTPEGDLWLSTSEGAIKIVADEVRQLSANPRHPVRYELFGFLDGMPGTPNAIRPLPSVAAGADGRLWFATTNGIVWIDPKNVRRNTLAPNVEVQAITADNRPYRPTPGLTLPIGVRNLQIDYTALSLSIPERVRFRYQLGAGEPWQDAGPRRTAYFTDLDPGDYTFRVTAANNDGVWNETGAAIEFTIPPAFYQTRWFYALCALALVGLLTLIYKVRMRQVAVQVRGRLEARLAERERIARELHDTLLQGMQGLIWRFQAATDRIPPDEPARQLMTQSLDRADQLLGESRDKVKDLRPAASDVVDLAQAVATEGEQFSELYSVKFEVSVQGTRRDLHPMVREEGFLVTREALSNAFRHAHAHSIETEVTYGDTALHIRIRDDGQGISAAVLDAGGRPGHFGLLGMRERAKKLGGHLDVWSKPGAGTEVELRVPADVAYRPAQTQARGIRSWFAAFNSSARSIES
jgi:signal transduction histidine kinase/ligand-binding sensor domain-containing protein